MERQLGPRPRQQLIVDWEKEVAAADLPGEFGILTSKNANSLTPLKDVEGRWEVCSPATCADFHGGRLFILRGAISTNRSTVRSA
jgi:hypothetical protein